MMNKESSKENEEINKQYHKITEELNDSEEHGIDDPGAMIITHKDTTN